MTKVYRLALSQLLYLFALTMGQDFFVLIDFSWSLCFLCLFACVQYFFPVSFHFLDYSSWYQHWVKISCEQHLNNIFTEKMMMCSILT